MGQSKLIAIKDGLGSPNSLRLRIVWTDNYKHKIKRKVFSNKKIMSNHKKSAFGLILCACCLISGCGKKETLVIYHTSDIRGWFWPRHEAKYGGKEMGGFAVMKKLADSEKRPHIIVDAGNWLHGAAESASVQGDVMVELMNKTGYAAAAVGYGEFALGLREFAKAANNASFNIAAANLSDAKTGGRLFSSAPFVIKEVGGLKVGIFGLTARKVSKMVFYENIRGIKILDEINEAKKTADLLEKMGVKIIILLRHSAYKGPDEAGMKEEKAISKEVPDIDVIISGGYSDKAYKPVKSGGTWIVHAGGGRLLRAGRAEMRINSHSGEILDVRHAMVELDKSKIGEDGAMAGLVKSYQETADRKLNRRIGFSPGNIQGAEKGESETGDWVADCMKNWRGSDAAIIDSGSISGGISSGPITLRTIYDLMPFDNMVVLAKLRGEDIIQIIEESVSDRIEDIQISGIKVDYDSHSDPGNRVKGVFIGRKSMRPVNPHRIYRLAISDSMLGNAEKFGSISNLVEFVNTRRFVREIIGGCISRQKEFYAPAKDRWFDRSKISRQNN